jgi:predicted kinase
MAMLVVVCGLPGVGKSTVAGLVADRLGGTRIRTDEVRQELVANPEYTPEETARVYDELFARAERAIDEGEHVVLDGTFKDAERRERAANLAAEQDVPFRLLKVECTEQVATERIENREDDPSEADVSVYVSLREEFDPVSMTHTTVDNSGSMDRTRARVAEVF